MGDAGFAVNADETILSGKVWFKGNESVLLLNPGTLVCRGFASANTSFSLKLDKITGCYGDQKNPAEFHVTAFIARSVDDPTLIQVTFDFRCPGPEEVFEWVEILQSALTERSVRAVTQNERASAARNETIEATVAELLSIFPTFEAEVIRTVVATNGGDLQKSLDELLTMSDPSYTPPPPVQQRSNTSTPADQLQLDEQLALALEDELFLEEVKKNEDWRRTIAPEQSAEFSVTDKLHEMSEATKRTFGDLYTKFKKATTGKGQPIELGEEMTPVKADVARPQPGYAAEEEDEEEDERLSRTPAAPGIFGRKDGYQTIPAQEKAEKPAKDGATRSLIITDDDL